MQGLLRSQTATVLFGVSSRHSAHTTLGTGAPWGVGVTLAFCRQGGGLGTQLRVPHEPFLPAGPRRPSSLLPAAGNARAQASLGCRQVRPRKSSSGAKNSVPLLGFSYVTFSFSCPHSCLFPPLVLFLCVVGRLPWGLAPAIPILEELY